MWNPLNLLHAGHLRLHFGVYLGDTQHTSKTEEKKGKSASYFIVVKDFDSASYMLWKFYDNR